MPPAYWSTRGSERWHRPPCRYWHNPDNLPRRVRPELLLAGVHRPAEKGPEDGHDPARGQVEEVPEGRGRARHRGLPALAPRAHIRGRDRQRRGEARDR